jgi:hypothetical protein
MSGMNGSPGNGNGDVKSSQSWNQDREKRRLEEEEKYLEELRNLRLSEENVSGAGHKGNNEGIYSKPMPIVSSNNGQDVSHKYFRQYFRM